MTAIFKRELHSYLNGVIGPAVIALLLLVAGALTAVLNLLAGAAQFVYVLNYMQFALIVAVPVLGMRAFSEEKKNRVDRLLYTLPIKLSDIVLGKYFAALAVFGISCAVLAVYPLALRTQGMSYLATSYVALITLFLLGAALLAVCMLLSSLTDSPIVAVLLGIGGTVLLFLPDVLVAVTPASGAFARLLLSVAVFSRYSNVCSGVFELGTLVLYLSITAFCLLLTVQVMERKRRR
jgi:ABC-2 type transport system permease protein